MAIHSIISEGTPGNSAPNLQALLALRNQVQNQGKPKYAF